MAASVFVEGGFPCADVYRFTYSSLEPPVVAGKDSLLITQRMSRRTDVLLYSTRVVGSLMIGYTLMQFAFSFAYVVTITTGTFKMVHYTS